MNRTHCSSLAPSAICWSDWAVLSLIWTLSSWAWRLALGWDPLVHQQPKPRDNYYLLCMHVNKRHLHQHVYGNLRGSSSSWFPLVAFSIFSPAARRHCRCLQIVFHWVCRKVTNCKCRTQQREVSPLTSLAWALKTLTQNNSWSLSHTAYCPWNGSWRTWPDRCSSHPSSCTFLACESQTSA